jgi:nicotinamide-nucleotide amidase
VPDVCTVLKNERGTAPGMLFEKNGKIFVSLPGVPHEMKWLMENHVLSMITQKFNPGFIEHRTLLTAGIGESYLADKIKNFEEALPKEIKLAYLPNYGMVRLRLTGYDTDKTVLTQKIDYQFSLLKEEVKDVMVIDEDLPLEAVVGKLLKEKGKTVSTAESCTGGYIAHLFTSIPGSSAYFTGSVVSYTNDVKKTILEVKEATLQSSGAVSEETVRQMAEGILKVMHTDYAIAVSGIMGPDGGTPDKPVGTVWIAVAHQSKIVAQKFNFRFDRNRNILYTATNALNLLRQLIVDNS